MSFSYSYRLDIPQCHHVKDDGLRCGSPALRGQDFCYHHDKVHNPRLLPGQKSFQFGALEGSASLALLVRNILQSYHDGLLNERQTRMYLYGLSVAAPYACRVGYVYPRNVTSELPPAMQALRDKSLCTANAHTSSTDPGLCSADTPVREKAESTTIADTISTTVTDTITTEPSRVAADANSPARSAGYASTEPSASAVGTTETDQPITSSPDHPISYDDQIRSSIFHPDPALVRAYWTQHLTPEDIDLRAPSGDLVYTPPTWLPLTPEQLQYLRDNLPPDRGPATPEQQENWERINLHCTHGHVTPPTAGRIRSAHRQLHQQEKEWADTLNRAKKIMARCPLPFELDHKKERS